MRRMTIACTFLMITGIVQTAAAEKLELGLMGVPTWLHDKNAEAVSSDNLFIGRFGADLRSEVFKAKKLSLVPLVAYRFGGDSGYVYDSTDTTIQTHDILAGLRVRQGLLSWLTAFGELNVGAEIATLTADMSTPYYDDYASGRESYEDTAATWSAGVMIGLETHFSRAWLASRGTDWFCFGGEIAFGYLRRGNLNFHPTLDEDVNSIDIISAGSWGDLNLSGMVLQLGINLYFL